MKLEVLYVADCPSYPAAVRLLKNVLATSGTAADVQAVLVADEKMARELSFSGSPTIRIDGRDIVTEPQNPERCALSCRIYPGSAGAAVPTIEMIERAVLEAKGRQQ
jgi:hypothetical protein